MMTILTQPPIPNPNRWSLNLPHPMLFNANHETTGFSPSMLGREMRLPVWLPVWQGNEATY